MAGVIACDRTEALLAQLDNKELTLLIDRDLAEAPAGLAAFAPELIAPRRLLFRYRASESPVPQILAAVGEAGLKIADMTTEETDLEDLFLQLDAGAPTTRRSARIPDRPDRNAMAPAPRSLAPRSFAPRSLAPRFLGCLAAAGRPARRLHGAARAAGHRAGARALLYRNPFHHG